MSETSIIPLDEVAFAFAPREWLFAQTHKAEIAAHFAAKQARTPSLWNGRLLLANEWSVANNTLRGTYFATDYANFVAWCDWGCPDRSVANCFAMGAIRTADDAFVLGVMGSHTVNPGNIYFPTGNPEPRDVVSERVDFDCYLAREVAQETGLTAADFSAEAGWTALLTGPHVALVRMLRSNMPSGDLRARILAHLARESRPELADVRIVRSPADFDPMIPAFVVAYLEQFL